jgi:hypothetical protein
MGIVTFVLGLLVAFGLVVSVAWLAVAAVAGMGAGTVTDQVSGSAVESLQLEQTRPSALAPPEPAPLAPPTPSGATLGFDELWVSGNGDTIVVGIPTVGFSALSGESMIQVPVTLTNNGERDWSPESTGFAGTLNHAPVAESAEGDWMYRAPIVPHTSVTLNKIFVGHPGQFTLRISTPDGVASFTGRI